MVKLDDSLLTNLGYKNLTEEQKKETLGHIAIVLKNNVGLRLATTLRENKLEQFQKALDGDPKEAVKWLEANIPNYKKIVEEELEKIVEDIKKLSK